MEASVAIVQLRQSAWSDRMNSSPHDYDILVLDEISRPSTSYARPTRPNEGQYVNSRTTVGTHSVGKTVISLPKFRISNDQLSLSDAVLESLADKTKVRYRRAVVVPLWDERPTAIVKNVVTPGTALVCAPALTQDKVQYPYGRLENLARLVNMCHNSPESLEIQTRHMLLRLEEWIAQSQCMNPHFLASLFVRPASSQRLIRCSHNPAYGGDEHEKCLKYIQKNWGSTKSVSSSMDLDEKVRIGNLAKVQMMTYNKCNTFVLNPLFGWLPFGEEQVPEYFAASKSGGRKKSCHSPNSNEFAGRYPLHQAAYVGDTQAIETLISRGQAINETDSYSWTALHYACFYGHAAAVAVLLTVGNADVNVQNKGGATPLHFAAMNGNEKLVELMLSHAKINKDLKNVEGRTALDLCEAVPKPQWQMVAKLLREWKDIDKIQIDFLEAGSAMVQKESGDETTVAQIIEQLTKEMKMSSAAAKLFGLWVSSESAEVQLKDSHKIVQHLNAAKWRRNVASWTDRDGESKETPRLVFKRNAHTTLEQEERLEIQAEKHEFAVSLLFDEARHNFLRGHYPCDEKQTILLATIIARLLYGQGSTLSDTSDLTLLLPVHLAIDRSVDWRKRINKSLKEPQSTNVVLLQRQFLRLCRQLKVYGSTFFPAEVYLARPHSQKRTLCGVNDYGFHLIELPSHKKIISYEYRGLHWELDKERNLLQMRDRAHGHDLTVRSPRAAHIDALLKKMIGNQQSATPDRAGKVKSGFLP